MTSNEKVFIQLPSRRFSQVLIWFGLLLTVFFLWLSNSYLTDRFTRQQGSLAIQRASLYSNSISSALQRNVYVPLLLSRDIALTNALRFQNYANTDVRLQSFKEDHSASSITLLDINGEIVAATDYRALGSAEDRPGFFVRALREEETVFQALHIEGVVDRYYYARKIIFEEQPIGVIVVEVDLQRQELIWRNGGALVALSDSEGDILLASDIGWRRLSIQELLSTTLSAPPSDRIFNGVIGDDPSAYAYINGERLLVTEVKIGFLGWRLTYFASMENVQAQVNALMALEIMILSLFAAFVFFQISRRTTRESAEIRLESAELRRLNARLSSEIEQRQIAEQKLETAAQSLEQSSKLAALGQMSASVSHELNQPLAAMRTYLAGARLLLQRNRTEEALTSFQRIDDLIERMGAITKQLKSHARKSDSDEKQVDLRDCVASAMSMMAPQLGKTQVNIVRNIPNVPGKVFGDPVRIEQIIVNLLRNALDATKEVDDKKIIVTVTVGEDVRLSVQDNGTGIIDPDALFEPFSTTKKPGEGVGLGLAISAGFATDMGGQLTGRNATPVGAIFELQLPRVDAR